MTDAPDFYVPQRILAVAAHADDLEFGFSGTAARWAAHGAHITYCIVTDSGSGDNSPGADLEQLKATRKAEQTASAKVVGVEDVRFLDGYADGMLEPTMDLRRDLTRVIREVRPNVVAVFDPEVVIAGNRDYINHPDHRAVAIATTYAVFPSAGSRPIFRELLQEGLEPHEVNQVYYYLTNVPDTFIDISEFMDKKRAALGCHRSQLDDRVIDMVAGWNRETGRAIGGGYAESFRVIRLKDEQTPPQD